MWPIPEQRIIWSPQVSLFQKNPIETTVFKLDLEGKGRIHQMEKWVKPQPM